MATHSPIDVEPVKKKTKSQHCTNGKSLPHCRRTGKKSKSQQFSTAQMVNLSPIDVELVKNPSLKSFALHKW